MKGPGARGEFHLVPNSYLQKGGTHLLAHDQACNRALCSGKFQYVDLDSILFLEVVLLITNFPYFTGLDPEAIAGE